MGSLKILIVPNSIISTKITSTLAGFFKELLVIFIMIIQGYN